MNYSGRDYEVEETETRFGCYSRQNYQIKHIVLLLLILLFPINLEYYNSVKLIFVQVLNIIRKNRCQGKIFDLHVTIGR